jgi:peptide/nickel transport system permease protein
MSTTVEALEDVTAVRSALHPLTWLSTVGRFTVRRPVGAAGMALFLFFVLMALTVPLYAPYGKNESDIIGVKGPSSEHLFGTDAQSRDVFSRVLWGSRVSVTVGIVTVVASVAIATIFGLLAGYFQGLVDTVIMRINDVFLAFPSLIIALSIVAVLGSSLRNVMIVIIITQVPSIARVARSAVLATKENQYVEAARAIGARDARIVLRHILPNIVPVLVVYSATYVGYAVVTEAALSFLGVGIPPEQVSWGTMISGEARIYSRRAPWMILFPSIALSLLILGINLFADAFRDYADPRLRGGR